MSGGLLLKKELPYDAEIEYLESTGTQYIDTGIIPDSNTGIEIVVSTSNSTDQYLVGLRDTDGNTRWTIGKSSQYYYGYGNYAPVVSRNDNTFVAELNYLNSGKFVCYYEATPSSITQVNLGTPGFTPVNNIRLFGSAGISASYTKAACKLYVVKISQEGNILMDLIPVRVEQVGYMYDKVSGQLFGNAGTGDFVLGNDKN